MKLGRIVEGLFLGPSHHSIGLQCAGLASGYLKKLRPRFAVHPATGEIAGVGLKRFPEPGDRAREHHRLF